ncbi:MAG: hypothetical protein RL266_994 [Bacteroidota bacterium]
MRRFLFFLVLSFVVGLIGNFTSQWDRQQLDNAAAEEIQGSILELDVQLAEVLQQITQTDIELKAFNRLWNERGIGIVSYQNNRAMDWTTNSIPFEIEYDNRHIPKEGIVRLVHSWYLCRTVQVGDQLLAAYALLHSSYDFQNRYIANGWSKTIGSYDRFVLTQADLQSHALVLSDGNSPIGLRTVETTDGIALASWNTLIWLVFLLLLLLAIWHASNWVSGSVSPLLGDVLLISLVLTLRALMLWLEMPTAIYSLELFGPTAHATSGFIPSLGDLLLHLITVLVIILHFRKRPLRFKHTWIHRSVAISGPVILVWPVQYLFQILVVNSSFSLDLNSPFSLNVYSLIGLVASFLVLIDHFLISQMLLRSLKDEDRQWKHMLPWIAIGTIVLLIALGAGPNALLLSLSAGTLLGMITLGQIWLSDKSSVYYHTPAILAYSILACIVLTDATTENEHETRVSLARKLDKKQDPITEYLFDDLAKTIKEDRKLRLALTAGTVNSDEVLTLIRQKLNYDHWNRYQSFIDIFREDGGLMVSDRERTGPNYFELQQFFESAEPSLSENLHYVQQQGSQGGYLAKLEIDYPRKQASLILFITLVPEKTDDILGFTDLFVDEDISTAQELEGYSFAIYQNGELQDGNGDYPYSLSDRAYRQFEQENYFFNADGYDHLAAKQMEGKLIMISRPSTGLIGYLTTFSYLFLFYLACAILSSVLSGKFVNGLMERKSFRNRINLAMTSVSFISLLLIGVLTVVYVIREYNARNEEMISEKSRSVLIELEHKLRDKNAFSEEDKEMLSALLIKFSKVFFTDINLYRLDGHLLATSRPRLFDEGLMAKVIDPQAYEEMRFAERSSFIHEETIGNLNYLTAYVPFRNDKREVIAFMSLPYFARQYGLQQEIFALLATLTNIYVFLILVSVVVALFISNRITEPLRIIRESLRNLKLDAANRSIEWKSNDEIGELVEEYNRTLNELVRSAEMLARSERESAWREMAKQVAHEIKNPLTPMKLSIQMLQRSMADGADDLNERIERTSRTLIEQIDTLSNIATEFSSFAQMPRSNIEQVELRQLLESTSLLYQNSEADVVLDLHVNGPCTVEADKEQLVRVFNNLIKNGIQAAADGIRPMITITLQQVETELIIAVQDNGTGIPEELQERIFVPNFTTKSSGMGLGLAMVKNIVEGANGRIWFQTDPTTGTVFYVSFPAV